MVGRANERWPHLMMWSSFIRTSKSRAGSGSHRGTVWYIQSSWAQHKTKGMAVKITTFNPLIITTDLDSTVALFEELGFEKKHVKSGISLSNATDIRMKDANGFHVDVAQGTANRTMIRVNVDNLEEAIAFLEERGFHKARHAAANKTIDTGSSKFNIMVSDSGYILAVSHHIKNHD